MKNTVRSIIAVVLAAALSGCATVPYEQLQLDTTTNFRKPSPNKAGVYVYQWKTGFIGAALDVKFEIRGLPTIALNTGEYGYAEVEPGSYEYKVLGGIFPTFIPVRFEAGKNYFFRAALSSAQDVSFLVRDQTEIDEAKANILSGRYEPYDAD